MFQQLQNIDSAFKHVRLFTLVIVLASSATSCYCIYKCQQLINESRAMIYILYEGAVLKATASKRVDNIKVEAKHHVESFHSDFFTLEPDEKVIKRNITRALYKADISAKRQYDNLRENRYYANIISGNVSQRIEVDSIQLFLDEKPYYFRYYGTQELIRTTSRVFRSLVTEGYLREVLRSDDNEHGFMIEKWNIIENRDIRTENR